MKRIFSLSLLLLLVSLMTFAQPKYIFYFIGDGMGMNHIQAAELYKGELNGKIGREPLCMSRLPITGMASTYSLSNGVTDSSAAGTALATGKKTNNGMLGMTPDGEKHMSIAEILHEKGWAVGLMTSVSIDHATPAAFYAKSKNRNDYYRIGRQLAETNFEFFGGATFYKPNNEKKADSPNLYALCEERGYTFCHGIKEMKDMGMMADKVILIQKHEGLEKDYQGEGRLPYAIDRKAGDLTLADITRSAIDFLLHKRRPFFMMVEGGQIDWASHGHDGATAINETLDFDEAIRVALDFYRQHPEETLIVITADHETGGIALGSRKYTLNLQELQYQKHSVTLVSEEIKAAHNQYGKKLSFDQVKTILQNNFGLYKEVEVTADEDKALREAHKAMIKNKSKDEKNMYATVDALANLAMKMLNDKAHLQWATRSHSAATVPVFAIGVGSENFSGYYDNTDIMPRILHAASH